MLTLTDSLVSASSRAVNLRRRSDLTATRQTYQGEDFWIVKDPVSLSYYRFHEEEYAILGMLDGVSSLEEIQRRFERRFRPQKIGTRAAW